MKTTNLRFVISIAALGLASTWLSSCNDSRSVAGTSDDPNQITASIEGVVEKGPFVKGTTVTLYELNPETFAQTGKTFTGTVDGDDGSFSLGKLELGSRYVLVEASGYYWNELYGLKSTNPLSLKAVAKVGKDGKININVGTHITHKRILSLVENGMEFDKAKEQAEKEVVEAFFGDKAGTAFENASIFDDEKLLALSVIMLLTGPEPDVTEMIASLTAGLTDDLLVKLADKAALRYNEYAYARRFMGQHFPDASIGYFEHYIIAFWQKVYGLGECNKDKSGVLDTVRAEKSENAGKVLICKEFEPESGVYLWLSASGVEQNTFGLEPVEDGHLVMSETDSTVAYVYVDGQWREATDLEIKIGKACVRATRGMIVSGIADMYSGLENEFVCALIDTSELYWKKATIRDYPKEMYFNPDVEYGSVTDKRDGRTYKTVDLAGMTWMAENLTYVIAGADCADSLSIGCRYGWNTAMDLAEEDTAESTVPHKGICMDGWHVPDTTEWNNLLANVSVDDLKSIKGWPVGTATNSSGFSLVPIDYYVGAGIIYSYSSKAYADYITANYMLVSHNFLPSSTDKMFPHGTVEAFEISHAKPTLSITPPLRTPSDASNRYHFAVLRCVKDSE